MAPVLVAAPAVPHETTHSAPEQFLTVHPVEGQVTLQLVALAQSTEQVFEVWHSTWQLLPASHPTSHD
jgi:hypothetical protein